MSNILNIDEAFKLYTTYSNDWTARNHLPIPPSVVLPSPTIEELKKNLEIETSCGSLKIIENVPEHFSNWVLR
mgnify:CR=1 FL=1